MNVDMEADVIVTSVRMEEEQTVVSYEGDVGKYGHVFFTHRLESTLPDDSKGTFTGYARTILADGGSVTARLQGVWHREGSDLTVKSLDDGLGIPDQNYVVVKVDLIERSGALELSHL